MLARPARSPLSVIPAKAGIQGWCAGRRRRKLREVR